VEFWRVWSGSGPICNYLSDTEDLLEFLRASEERGEIYHKYRGSVQISEDLSNF
jgi:hypothetical protein